MMSIAKLSSDEVNLATGNHLFSNFLATSNTLSRKNDMNHKLWNTASTDKYILHIQVMLECCYI